MSVVAPSVNVVNTVAEDMSALSLDGPRFRWWWLSSPLLVVASQACYKLVANGLRDVPFGAGWFEAALRDPYALGIVFTELAGLAVWLKILSTVPVSRAMPLTAICYVAILLLGWFGFHEAVLPLQVVGSALILAGIWCVA